MTILSESEVSMEGVAVYDAVQRQNDNDLIVQHTGLVKKIAYHMITRLPPNVQVDDLIQSGSIGLIEAARNFDSSQGASFETYASIRIRGAMLDEIRRSDWTPRTLRKKMRDLSEVIRKVENDIGKQASGEEIAQAMGLEMDEYNDLLTKSTAMSVLSLDELLESRPEHHTDPDAHAFDPLASLEDDDFKLALASMIEKLPERERLVMGLYYEEGLNLKEIGLVLEVSESRVCQIHGQALARVRSKMKAWL